MFQKELSYIPGADVPQRYHFDQFSKPVRNHDDAVTIIFRKPAGFWVAALKFQ